MLKDKIIKNETIYGTWCEIYSPYVSNIIAKSDMDFIFVDFEHGPFNFETIQNMTFAAQCDGCAVIARVSEFEKAHVLNVLDMGVDGMIFPHILNMEQVKEIVKLTKFYPQGERGYNPFVRSCGYKAVNQAELMNKNKNQLLFIIIEDMEGIDNLEEIASCDEIDGIYVGQYDLSVALAIPGELSNPKLTNVMDKALNIIKSKSKMAGCMVHSVADAKIAVENGYQMIAYAVDSNLVFRAYSEFRKGVDDK